MSPERAQFFRQLGAKAAERKAAKLNASNANSFAVESIAYHLAGNGSNHERLPYELSQLQRSCQTDLSMILHEPDVAAAITCVCGGAFEWLEQNPD